MTGTVRLGEMSVCRFGSEKAWISLDQLGSAWLRIKELGQALYPFTLSRVPNTTRVELNSRASFQGYVKLFSRASLNSKPTGVKSWPPLPF
jgi:hypothetical protein